MTGRQVQGIRTKADDSGKFGTTEENARFPSLTKQAKSIISASALRAAKQNYYKKYDELNEKMMQDQVKIGERIAEIQGKNRLDDRRDIARKACITFADGSILAMSANPPKGAFGTIFKAVLTTGAAVAIGIGTGGIANGVSSVVEEGLKGVHAVAEVVSAGAGAIAGGIGGLVASGNVDQSGGGNGETRAYLNTDEGSLMGSQQNNQWNYKETITTTFEWDTLVCHKCVRAENCADTRHPLFGRPYCDAWDDPIETCTDTQF